MQFNFRNDVLPHIVGVVIFYCIVMFYFSPAVFDGKIIFQYDILQWEGASKEILDYRAETGEEALWTNRLFGGMPAYLVSYEIPGDITNFITKLLTIGLPHPVNSLFFGMVAMYILLLSFRVRPEFSIIGAIGFAFNTFHVISLDAGHNAKIWAICLIPLILAGIHLAFQRKYLLGAALFAMGMMLQFKFNHLQITYYTVLIVIIYGISRIVEAYRAGTFPHFGKTMGILVLALLLALGANLSRFLAVMEYGTYSTRGPSNITSDEGSQAGLDRQYAFNWSQGKLETLTLLVPYLYGGGSTEALGEGSKTEEVLRAQGVEPTQIRQFVNGANMYWGDQPGTGGPIYGGAIILFLFVIGLIYAPKNYKLVFLSITLLSLILAWGSNLEWLNYALFDYLPGYNKFRAVTMALCMALFAIPVLGSIGLEYYFHSTDISKRNKNLGIALASTAGLALLIWLFAGMFSFRAAVDEQFPTWLVDALRSDRKAWLRSSALKSLVFIVISGGLIFGVTKKKLSTQMAGLAIAILLIVDLWSINTRYLNQDDYRSSPSEQFFAKTPADEKILQDTDYFRVLNIENPFNDARTSYYFNSVGGYHGAKMKRYQELIENVLSPQIQNFIAKAQEGEFDWESISALNMLNTKYLMAGRGENAVFQNPAANGPAWFPSEIIQIDSDREEIAAVAQFDATAQATLNKSEFGEIQAGNGRVELTDRTPNELTYAVKATNPGLLVFSEIYYPKGWKAYVDDSEVDIVRTNYLLRGIDVPQGSSTVRMEFRPGSHYNTKTLAVILQYFIVLALLGSLFWVGYQGQRQRL